MKVSHIVFALFPLAALAACAETAPITGAEARTRPAFNGGGFGMGSGGVTPTDTTQSEGMGTTAPVTPDSSDGRGGFGMGSGG